MQTLDGWLSVMSFDLADSAFNNQWFMQIKKNGQIKHQTDMTQTRLSKTNIWVNWVKDHVQACDLDLAIFEKCVFCIENGVFVWKIVDLKRKLGFWGNIKSKKCHFLLKMDDFDDSMAVDRGIFETKRTDLTPILIIFGHFARKCVFSPK